MTAPDSSGPSSTAGGADPNGAAQPVVAALQQVLLAHHAAVFGYPALGVHLDQDAEIAHARADEAAHRLSRDAIIDQLLALGATADAAQADYAPPAPLTTASAARGWALELEERTAAGYRFLLLAGVQAGGSQQPIRTQAMTGLTGAAGTALYWRRLLHPQRPTVPFPGT
ncbi:MAG TPA: DUF4439 domain-containing protein [Jatrophihabitans sp.]|nr:DUF4439 domain-containing protein [Jatrophihabitans sp.]